jgi:hypothetical protein
MYIKGPITIENSEDLDIVFSLVEAYKGRYSGIQNFNKYSSNNKIQKKHYEYLKYSLIKSKEKFISEDYIFDEYRLFYKEIIKLSLRNDTDIEVDEFIYYLALRTSIAKLKILFKEISNLLDNERIKKICKRLIYSDERAKAKCVYLKFADLKDYIFNVDTESKILKRVIEERLNKQTK